MVMTWLSSIIISWYQTESASRLRQNNQEGYCGFKNHNQSINQRTNQPMNQQTKQKWLGECLQITKFGNLVPDVMCLGLSDLLLEPPPTPSGLGLTLSFPVGAHTWSSGVRRLHLATRVLNHRIHTDVILLLNRRQMIQGNCTKS